MIQPQRNEEIEGLLLVDKPRGKTAFTLVAMLRRLLGVKKIGHAGTLDPFATGVMVMLIGRSYTRLSDKFLTADKEYIAEVHLGISTDTFDCDGTEQMRSTQIPTLAEIESAVAYFQGEIDQIPPMFSAKKLNGKKLYELARQGKVVERQSVKVNVKTEILNYQYPKLEIAVVCSKGTYIRSIAHELGAMLGCGAHLTALRRTRSGNFRIENCLDGALLQSNTYDSLFIQDRFLEVKDFL